MVSSGHERTTELRVAVSLCTMLAQDEASQHPSTDGQGAHGLPSLAEELLAAEGH